MTNDSDNADYHENLMKQALKHPRVEVLQSVNAEENVTPENLHLVTKSQVCKKNY